jgi:MoaA/NifB/PqqE/SkfB family radical SAM enzyme
MLTGIHILLTYNCNFTCDHCFLYSEPDAEGIFTLAKLRKVFSEIPKIGSIEWVYFEGGEPFLFYPLMLRGLKMAKDIGLKTGVVTNAYWAENVEDAELWLEPLVELEVSSLTLSDDAYHHDDPHNNAAKWAAKAAEKLAIPSSTICVEKPRVIQLTDPDMDITKTLIEGGTMFRGRAVEKLIHGLPRRHWEEFTECPYEKLDDPGRVHIDPFGNVHLCQGLVMGNISDSPLSELVAGYDPQLHPICGPIIKGGPAQLAWENNIVHTEGFVDECHMCYFVRRELIEKFPEYLTPRQVYGLSKQEKSDQV